MSAIIEKIKKLMALATNSGATESEATTALEMASALMMKHNIDNSDLIEKPDMGLKRVQFPDFDDNWHGWVSSAVGQLNTVKPIYYGQGTFAFIGRVDSIECAALMFPWIVDQIEKLYKRDLPKGLTKSARANFRRTYKQGVAMRVCQRVNEIMQAMKTDDAKAQASTGTTALVVVQTIQQQLSEIEEWMAKNFGGTIIKKKSRGVRGGLGTSAGIRAGDQVQINKSVPGHRLAITHRS